MCVVFRGSLCYLTGLGSFGNVSVPCKFLCLFAYLPVCACGRVGGRDEGCRQGHGAHLSHFMSYISCLLLVAVTCFSSIASGFGSSYT